MRVGGADGVGRAAGGRLLAANVAACVLLLVQYLLGMVVNLYVVLPGRHPGARAGDYFTGAVSGLGWVISDGPGWAAAHAAFGMALAAAALASLALARRQNGRTVLVLSVLGALAIVGAGFNGASFLDYGHAFSSVLMAGLWALALACYGACGILAARRLGDRQLSGAPADRRCHRSGYGPGRRRVGCGRRVAVEDQAKAPSPRSDRGLSALAAETSRCTFQVRGITLVGTYRGEARWVTSSS